MTTITSVTVLEATARGNGSLYVVFQVELSTETLHDGPRFLPVGTELTALGEIVGQRVLDGAIAQELNQWQ